MSDQKTSKLTTFYTFLKTVFVILLILQFVPKLFNNVKSSFDDQLTPKPQIGFLPINGELTSSRVYSRHFEEFEKNEHIKALIVYFECSPGGFPGTSQAIFQDVLRFKTKKPVVAMVENLCASGAYYIACGADRIVSTPSAIIGSIGVAMRTPNVKELLDSWKIKHILVQSGTYKMAGDPRKDIQPEDVVYLQNMSDDAYNQFVKDVAQQRGLSVEKQADWANGKCFTGNQALALNLIDQVGSHRDAIDLAKMLAGIKEEVKVVSLKKDRTGLQRFVFGDDDGTESEYSAKNSAVGFATEVCSNLLQKSGLSVQATRNPDLYM